MPGGENRIDGQAAQALGLHLYSMEVSRVEDYEAAFQAAVEAGNTALWVTLNPLANSHQKKLADLALTHGLPSICARADYADNGCMMAYGPGYSIEGEGWRPVCGQNFKGDQAGQHSGGAAAAV